MKKLLFYILVLAFLIVGCAQNPPATTPPPSPTTTTMTTTTTTTTVTTLIKPKFHIAASELGLVDRSLHTYGKTNQKLSKKLETVLDNYNHNISIACWSTDGSKALLYNTRQTYFSACTIKMPLMYAYCKQIDSGAINPNEKHTYQSQHWYGGSGSIRYKSYGTQFTTRELIQEGLSISDNVAYVMLLEAYGKDPLRQLASDLDCKSLNFASGSKWAKSINARDLAVAWSEIYEYFNTESAGAAILKNSCTNTKFNYGTRTITEYDYSHKSGDNFGQYRAYHDAGIVWSNTPYVYVVLTQSEGTAYDRETVDTAMEIVKNIMTSN